MDILITLAKLLDLASVQHLLELNALLPITAHTKQTLLLSSLLTRNIWSAGLTGYNPEKKIQHPVSLKKPCKFFLSYWVKKLAVLFINSSNTTFSFIEA